MYEPFFGGFELPDAAAHATDPPDSTH